VFGRLLTGALVMSEKKLSKIKDQVEVTALATIFIISLVAITPGI
tara:strand:- start:284 stop:418 length:135 start_codon:yes stop_codon:yes gene_type:complete